MPDAKTFSIDEIKKHNSEESIWVVIDGGVYDMTSFLDDHPGGKKPVLRMSGKDASEAFWTYHNEKILSKIGAKLKIGELEPNAKL
ncbi:cytochrome b5 [Ceraceosorus bombacis]|uniref:Cytochrome b5 n=1 Tax=Ceraceosorus bombacis TaxID=401625 RepID=A0A0P1BCK9_9BASI|nr:cytochrome b5 [Ceraceosorus bombacis]